MNIYYKDGFYIEGVHNEIPEGAILISEELYQSLLEGQSNGKVISAPDDEHKEPWLNDAENIEIDKKTDILRELEQVDKMVSARTVREAVLGDELALSVIESAEQRAQELRKKLAELE